MEDNFGRTHAHFEFVDSDVQLYMCIVLILQKLLPFIEDPLHETILNMGELQNRAREVSVSQICRKFWGSEWEFFECLCACSQLKSCEFCHKEIDLSGVEDNCRFWH